MTHKFIVSSAQLLRQLSRIASVARPGAVVPILENVRLQLVEGTLTLTTSDLRTTLTASLPVEAALGAHFTACVPAKMLLDTLKALPDQPVTITVGDEKPFTCEVKSANGRYKLAGEDASDWPKPGAKSAGAATVVLLTPSELRAGLAATAPHVSSDELRPAMTGVLIDLATDEVVKFVVTDGHRLYKYTVPTVGEKWGLPTMFIIPGSAASLLLGLLKEAVEPVRLQLYPSHATVELPGWSWSAQLIDERYPDYNNVIPISNPNKLLMDRDELLGCLKRLMSYTNRTTHQVRLDLSGSELVMSAEDLNFSNSARETFAVQYDGEDLAIGFNARFLLSTLQLLPEGEVQVELSTPHRAGLFAAAEADKSQGHLLALVMPTMLNQYA